MMSLSTSIQGECYLPKISGIDHENFETSAVLFSGNANKSLALSVANLLGIQLGSVNIKRFNDGEISIQIDKNVRNKEVFIMQSTCSSNDASVNDNLMELILLVRAIKRSSAASVTAVIPYYGYARQDRKCRPRVPISAADVAMLIEGSGVDRVVSVDLHCGQIQGFFRNAPVDNLYASIIFVPYFVEKKLSDVVVVSPDAGGVKRAKQFAENLASFGIHANMAMISKERAGAGVIDSMQLIGNVDGKHAIIVDDLCDTAGTLCKAAKLLKKQGARSVYAAITHPVFSGPALERIGKSVIKEMVIADTIPLKPNAPSNIKQVSIAPLLAEAIKRIHNGESVSELFRHDWSST